MQKLTTLIMSDGERYPMLINESGVPDFWTTMYVTANLRVGQVASTIENTLRSILHLKKWELSQERDLISEFMDGSFLTNTTIHSIRDHCLLDARDMNRQAKTQINKNIIDISVHFPSNIKHFDVVGKLHFKNRMSHIAEFLHFCADTISSNKSNYHELYPLIQRQTSTIKAQAAKIKSKSASNSNSQLKAPHPDVFDEFMEIIHEEHPENPYKSPVTKFRNAVMFELMYHTGARTGEVLSLKIPNIDFQENSIFIERTHDDIFDPRSRQPVAKTQERPIKIPHTLADRLREYVIDYRANVKNANKHPYLFVTHKAGKFEGRPTTDSNFRNTIMNFATQRFPELFNEITRHGFRHNFNHRLSLKIDEHNAYVRANPIDAKKEGKELINEKQELQIRKQLNGWVSDDTAQTYLKRYTQELSNKMMEEDMRSQTKMLRKGVKKDGEI